MSACAKSNGLACSSKTSTSNPRSTTLRPPQPRRPPRNRHPATKARSRSTSTARRSPFPAPPGKPPPPPGLPPPFSCEAGNCGTCIGRLTDGHATMRNNDVLEDDEIADGYVLTCQGVPDSASITVVYE